jgi:hypothetical protein
MRRMILPILLLIALITACNGGDSNSEVDVGASVSPIRESTHYSNDWMKVELEYPASWVPIEGNQLGGEDAKFQDPRGESFGFFGVSALGGEDSWTLDYAAEQQASHKLKPFGDEPNIATLNLPAGEARLITPDPDFPDLRFAQLLIRYPVPINEGAISQPGLIIPVYYFFVLYADVNSIETIAKTVRFSQT